MTEVWWSLRENGANMSVEDWSMYCQDKQGYLGFLQSCVESENIHALFLLGLEEIFNLGKDDLGLRYLQLAFISKYPMGLWWFRDDLFRSYGIYLLNELSNNAHWCRKQASKIFSTIIWQKWPSLLFIHCKNLSCGTSILEGDNL